MNPEGTNYSSLDRLLHEIALGTKTVREVSFQLERLIYRGTTKLARSEKAVFVVGLARSGTTVILEALHRTGDFKSLSYRDMPFVLMPRIWGRVARMSRKNIAKRARAHGDSILIDLDSPESFEEVFWQTFGGQHYRHDTYIEPHDPTAEVLALFREFVAATASAGESTHLRYLSKNNNNILRLPGLTQVLPDASFLMIFRNPVRTAQSLFTQHKRFSIIQGEDPFSLRYLTWLGHYEFGLAHKPFRFAENTMMVKRTPDEPDYWLAYWIEVYEYVLRLSCNGHLFVNYDALCLEPLRGLCEIGSAIDCSARWEQIAGTFRHIDRPPQATFSAELVAQAFAVYHRLEERALTMKRSY